MQLAPEKIVKWIEIKIFKNFYRNILIFEGFNINIYLNYIYIYIYIYIY